MMCSSSKVTLALNFVGYNYDGAVSWKMLWFPNHIIVSSVVHQVVDVGQKAH